MPCTACNFDRVFRQKMSLLDFPTATGKRRKDLIARARKTTGFLKALSHEARILILCLLADGEKSVSEIEDVMKMAQAAVSQQLARLRRDGIVAARRDGRNIYYSLASDDVAALIVALHELGEKPGRPAPRRRK
jgi:DNA-binding transcriptional ArsR family regulator